MIDYKLDGNILEVIQTNHSFVKTSKEYWYYDIVEWKKSNKGQKNESPHLEMTEAEIKWVKDWYLPKVKA